MVCDDDDNDIMQIRALAEIQNIIHAHTRQIRGELVEIRKLVDPSDMVLWG